MRVGGAIGIHYRERPVRDEISLTNKSTVGSNPTLLTKAPIGVASIRKGYVGVCLIATSSLTHR